MSGQQTTRPKVPEGQTEYYTTRQKAPNEKGYVGYDVIWKPMQKTAEYTTPKKP